MEMRPYGMLFGTLLFVSTHSAPLPPPNTARTPAVARGARIMPHTPMSRRPAYMENRERRG